SFCSTSPTEPHTLPLHDALPILLTLTQYQNSYGSGDAPQIDFTRPLPSLLRDLLTQSPILFLGCSLNHDRVIKLVKQVAEEKKFAHHYAIVEHPGSENAFLLAKPVSCGGWVSDGLDAT